ncbi:MAG TPA: AAA family ATPase [Candidatus Limnocylindrales bacterium]|nr:AAA family ATPase [Candidatus Limnocylindrales bacterium]
MRTLSQELISPAIPERFALEGMAQLDHLLIGEEEAKLAMLIGMVAGVGMNSVLVGEAGGGKTTLAVNSHRIVDGIDIVASVPPKSDLTPHQLVGGRVEMTKTVTRNGATYQETSAAKIEPIIPSNAQVIVTNELNRVNPYAVNAILDGLESGTLTTSAGTRSLTDLLYGVATMNPAENKQAVFPVSNATASRHAIGAILGAKSSSPADRAQLVSDVWDDWEPRPDLMRPVIDLAELDAIRHRAERGIATPRSLKPEIVSSILRTSDRLQQKGIYDADGRLAKQVRRVAKAHATLAGQDAVEREDVHQALKFVVTARIGMLGTRAAHHQISEEVKSIINGG